MLQEINTIVGKEIFVQKEVEKTFRFIRHGIETSVENRRSQGEEEKLSEQGADKNMSASA